MDEPSASNILEPLPTPSATPTPSPEPSPTPQCSINCPLNLTNDYPSHSTYYKYDAFGKMIVVTQGVQKRYFLYDSFGRLLRVRQPEQEVNDSLDTQQSVDTNNQWTTGFVYDIFGNIKRATDANGVNIIYEYDKANRLIKRCYTKPNFTTTATECSQLSASDLNIDTPAVENFYDGKGLTQTQSPNYAKGKLTKITSSVSETRFTLFDNLGRILQSEQRTPSGDFANDCESIFFSLEEKKTISAYVETLRKHILESRARLFVEDPHAFFKRIDKEDFSSRLK